MTSDEMRIFLEPHATREESEIRKLARGLVERFNTMYQILSIIINDETEEYMEYLSNVYTESVPILTAITCYFMENNMSGKNSKIDSNIISAGKVLGLLKVLHERNVCRKNGIRESNENEYCKLSNHDILLKIKDYLETM